MCLPPGVNSSAPYEIPWRSVSEQLAKNKIHLCMLREWYLCQEDVAEKEIRRQLNDCTERRFAVSCKVTWETLNVV